MEMAKSNFRGGEGRGVKMLQTYRPSDKAGPRGAFAPKKQLLRSLGRSSSDRVKTSSLKLVFKSNNSA